MIILYITVNKKYEIVKIFEQVWGFLCNFTMKNQQSQHILINLRTTVMHPEEKPRDFPGFFRDSVEYENNYVGN